MPRHVATISEPPEALLLVGEVLSSNDANICTLLEFWGIRYRTIRANAPGAPDPKSWPKRCCILSSATQFARILNKWDNSTNIILDQASSFYIYGFDNSDRCIGLLRELTGDDYSLIQ